MRSVTLVAILLVAVLASQAPTTKTGAASGIIATFAVGDESFRAHVENPETIKQIWAVFRGQSTATIPVGRLLPGEEYNTGWSWHLDPWDIQMAEVAIELCDGLPSHIEANLDYWLNTVGSYCPWNAELLEVTGLGVGGIAAPPEVALGASSNDAASTWTAIITGGTGAAGGLLVLGASVWLLRRRRRAALPPSASP